MVVAVEVESLANGNVGLFGDTCHHLPVGVNEFSIDVSGGGEIGLFSFVVFGFDSITVFGASFGLCYVCSLG